MNQAREQLRDGDANRGREAPVVVCPACGVAARRASAHFCATCGRGLRERAYAPADSLLASYHQQQSRPAMLIEQEMSGVRVRRTQRFSLPAHGGNTSAAIALVMVCCSLFPFYGIMFSPFVIVFGGFGLVESWLFRRVGGVRLVFTCIACGLLIAGVQVLIWMFLLSYL